MSSSSNAPKFALPTPKFMPGMPPGQSVWNLLDMPQSVSEVQRESTFLFPPAPPEPVSPAPEPVLPCGPLAEPALADPCGLLADDGGVTGPVGVESHRSEEGEGVSTLENPLDGDGLDGGFLGSSGWI